MCRTNVLLLAKWDCSSNKPAFFVWWKRIFGRFGIDKVALSHTILKFANVNKPKWIYFSSINIDSVGIGFFFRTNCISNVNDKWEIASSRWMYETFADEYQLVLIQNFQTVHCATLIVFPWKFLFWIQHINFLQHFKPNAMFPHFCVEFGIFFAIYIRWFSSFISLKVNI